MKKRLGLMISGNFPCVRAGKFTHALNGRGFEHDALALKLPRQFTDSYRKTTVNPFLTAQEMGRLIRNHPGEILHVHNEPNWPVIVAKENSAGRPVVMNVHDLACARPGELLDPYEEAAFEAADAFIFVSEDQRSFAQEMGLDVEGKPYCTIGNYITESLLVEEAVMPHIGGVVYAGGTDPRNGGKTWRDYSPLADKLDGQLHIYPGNMGTDYGIVHETISRYPVLIHRLSQHDWGFVGTYRTDIAAHQHSVPNKVFDYFAAGIPILVMNAPQVRQYTDLGMGVYLTSLDELPFVTRLDRRPYVQRVMEERKNHTMEAHIDDAVVLYSELGVE